MIDMLNRIRLPQAVEYYKNALYGDDEPTTEDFRSFVFFFKTIGIGLFAV